MKERDIALDFQAKEITIHEIILPLRDINSLTTLSMERAWTVIKSMAYQPRSMQETTQ
jgi:hypothetical protein